jgi:hypothetical protein
MKLNVVLLLLSINFQSCSGNNTSIKKENNNTNMDTNQTMPIVQDSILQKLKAIGLKEYIGKPIDSLLANKSANEFKEYIYVDSKPGLLTSLLLKFSDSLYVEIFFDKFRYIKPFDTDKKWDFEHVKKEAIGDIKVLYNNKYIDL